MTSAGGRTAQERIAYHRYAAEMARARDVTKVALLVTVAICVAYDFLVFPQLGRGSLVAVIGAQAAIAALMGSMLAVLDRDPLPPERVVVPLGAAASVLIAIDVTFLATRMGGLTSPLPAAALGVMLMVQVLALPYPWRPGILVTSATALAYPITTIALTAVDDRLAAELSTAAGRAHFAGVVVVIAALVVLATWGGHIIWALRQSAFENKSIGRYRLLRRIGKGGMGEVWRAHDRALRRDVALKLLTPDLRNDPDRVARFERESEATAELTHPNTIRVHDWGVTHDGVWYYAMELLDGVDLATLVRRHNHLPAPLVVHLGLQAARALAEAHTRGVIHRDIKPANLFLVARDGAVDHLKVLDFGVARVDAQPDVTQAGAVVGTPGYLAPEILAGASASPASDVWSLAATLFFAATGAPWPSTTTALPPAFDALLRRALDPSPSERPPDASAFAGALAATNLAELIVLRLDPTAPPPIVLPSGADQMDTLAHQPTILAGRSDGAG